MTSIAAMVHNKLHIQAGVFKAAVEAVSSLDFWAYTLEDK
jgi:hypothetical protein